MIRQGDHDTDVYLLKSAQPNTTACVKVSKTLENGSETLLGIRVSGDTVGEMALFRNGGGVRSATVTTCTPIIAHPIPRDRFLGFVERHRDAWEAIGSLIADRLEWANRRRLEFAGYGVTVRLARVMIELIDRHGVRTPDGFNLGVRLSQTELGKLIGAREDAVGQAMRQLRSRGYVRSRYREVTVVDLAALRRFAELA